MWTFALGNGSRFFAAMRAALHATAKLARHGSASSERAVHTRSTSHALFAESRAQGDRRRVGQRFRYAPGRRPEYRHDALRVGGVRDPDGQRHGAAVREGPVRDALEVRLAFGTHHVGRRPTYRIVLARLPHRADLPLQVADLDRIAHVNPALQQQDEPRHESSPRRLQPDPDADPSAPASSVTRLRSTPRARMATTKSVRMIA